MAGIVLIVQGGQWGSEAKGLVAHKLTVDRKVDVAIRTGTVNAGHTVYYHGKPYAMQQLPVSWVRHETKLVLGPGAYIHPDILEREVQWIADAMYNGNCTPVLERLFIDVRCGLHLDYHTLRAKGKNRHHSIGTTGKGCSEAVVGKIMGRDADRDEMMTFMRYVDQVPGMQMFAKCMTDTVQLVNHCYDQGDTLLVEGTQGTMLDLHLGPYPYTTHKQTQAASWLAEAGLSCNVRKEVWGVYRTYPIRVAGNSGPMPGEISWFDFARQIRGAGAPESHCVNEGALHRFEEALQGVRSELYPSTPSADPARWTHQQREQHREAASELHAKALAELSDWDVQELGKLLELTTVTKKLRRIAQWDWEVFKYSAMLNRPDYVALTFMNYKWPVLWGTTHDVDGFQHVYDFTRQVGLEGDTLVGLVSFGPQLENFVRVLA